MLSSSSVAVYFELFEDREKVEVVSIERVDFHGFKG